LIASFIKVKKLFDNYDKIDSLMIGDKMENHPLEQLITEYLTEKDITKGSYGLYDTNLKQYLSSLVEQDITYAATQDVIEYIVTKKSKRYSDK
jgi:hypothetical protein